MVEEGELSQLIMNEFLSSPVATFVAGLISGWLLFELTEWRKRYLARNELRRALVIELENAEVLLSTIIAKYAWTFRSEEDVALVAKEIRWYQNVGRQRMQDAAIVSDKPSIPQAFDNISDSQLVQLFSTTRETIGTKIILPVLESALAGHTLGLDACRIQALGMVRWQAFLLEQDAESMKEFFRLTFTVTDPKNHQIAVENHDGRTKAYANRARVLLRVVRTALERIR